MFDVLVKRIHEYKRQHLKVLHIVWLYHGIKSNPSFEVQPRTFIFGGKAAPGYHLAKLMIKLITAVGDVINRDPDVRDRLKVVFLPNFNVKNGQRVYPAADLSEQISTAGKEASGTGNMKFSMNGALTIGTLDGANIEIREEVGAENFFLFGLSAPEVYALKAQGYRPMDYYNANQGLRDVIDLIRSGFFSRGDTESVQETSDRWPAVPGPLPVAGGFSNTYIDCQNKVSDAYGDSDRWTRMSILNTARSGKFSSDRTIREYCADIWRAKSGADFNCSHMRKQEPHSAPQRLGRTPQQLIAHGEGGQVFAAHRKLAQPADGQHVPEFAAHSQLATARESFPHLCCWARCEPTDCRRRSIFRFPSTANPAAA